MGCWGPLKRGRSRTGGTIGPGRGKRCSWSGRGTGGLLGTLCGIDVLSWLWRVGTIAIETGRDDSSINRRRDEETRGRYIHRCLLPTPAAAGLLTALVRTSYQICHVVSPPNRYLQRPSLRLCTSPKPQLHCILSSPLSAQVENDSTCPMTRRASVLSLYKTELITISHHWLPRRSITRPPAVTRHST